MLIDTHAHLNFNAYKDDADEVIKRALKNNVWMINVGSQYSSSKRAVEIAERYTQGVYATVGFHPIHLETGLVKIKLDKEEVFFHTKKEMFDYEKYRDLAKSSKVVAIGEIGLDYYYKPKSKIKFEEFKEQQKKVFLEQIELAKELNLPIIFHCRFAHDDLIQILNEQQTMNNEQLKGVIHCFTGTWEQAKQYLEMGFYLGFNGIIFKLNLDEIIKKSPIDKILLETDCPYLSPPEFKKQRNEPLSVKYIAERVAKIKNLSFNEVVIKTTQNTKKLFAQAFIK